MNNFILYSVIASVVLTLALNLLPLLFPRTANTVHRKLEQQARRAIEQNEDPERPNIKVFFPWKAMLIASIGLTVLVNLVGFLARG